jgi:hypothetical protein
MEPIMDEREVVRCSFDMRKDLHEKLCYHLPYGTKSHFYNKIMEIAVDGIEYGGYEVVGAILKGDLNPLAEAIKKRDRIKIQEQRDKAKEE